jgi:hypothetical protein
LTAPGRHAEEHITADTLLLRLKRRGIDATAPTRSKSLSQKKPSSVAGNGSYGVSPGRPALSSGLAERTNHRPWAEHLASALNWRPVGAGASSFVVHEPGRLAILTALSAVSESPITGINWSA